MKNKLLLFIFTIIILMPEMKVFALEMNNHINTSFTNENGVTLTLKEFNFVNDFYGSNFFDTMTLDDYNWIQDLDINNSNVEIVSSDNDFIQNINNGSSIQSTSHSTSYKKITIAKSCNSICTVITNVTWFANPTIRSYDLIGFRFYNTSLYNNIITTKVTSSNGTEYFSNNKVFSNGLGTSVKLPTNASNISIQQKIYTNTGGIIYASYQHAVSNISLQTSLCYTISSGGLGNVFSVYGDAIGKFDQMGGVEINL